MKTKFGFPRPTPLKSLSQVYDLKTRLDWGEPALTIIDVSQRDVFNACHITGAVSMPLKTVVKQAEQTLSPQRDIYVYGETDKDAAIAASLLKQHGYRNVSQLRGGVAAWKAVGFPIECRSAQVA
ncbi:MAG: rhodanese-like domain-containing protein [Leptolyngbya sp. SIO4C1]|nr:rhodanese-like domain-containing protein [Leptolyngbya sp. SIO4C1]